MRAEEESSSEDDVVLLSARRVSPSPSKKKKIELERTGATLTNATDYSEVEEARTNSQTPEVQQSLDDTEATLKLEAASTCPTAPQLTSVRAHSLPPLREAASHQSLTCHGTIPRRRRSLSNINGLRKSTIEAIYSDEAGPSRPLRPRSVATTIARDDSNLEGEANEGATIPLVPAAESDQALQRWAQMPPTPPRRNLRTRKPAQLAPYTTEMQRYRRRLVRNDWEDAVVVEREYLRAQREKRREREGLSVEQEDANQVDRVQDERRRRKGKDRRIEAETTAAGTEATLSSASHRSERERIAEDIMMRFGGAISSSSDEEEHQAAANHQQDIGPIKATSPSSGSSSQGARPRKIKRHRNALFSDSEKSTPEVHEISSDSATESEARDTDDATTVSQDGFTTYDDQLSKSRDKDGYTIEERRTYEHHLKYLKRLMPIRQARVHAADVIAMQREKGAQSRECDEDQAGDWIREDSPGSLRPGETRTRIAHQRDWAATRLIDDADEESDDSQIPSPESSLPGSSSSESDSQDEVIEDHRGPIDYWPQPIYTRKRDNIDRLLTHAVIKSSKRRKKTSNRYRHSQLASTVLKERRVIAKIGETQERRQKKRRRLHNRRGAGATHSTRQPVLLLCGNPQMATVKHRSRYSLIEDSALFDAFTSEFAKAKEKGEIAAAAKASSQQNPSTPYSQRSAESGYGKENAGQSIHFRAVQPSTAQILVERGDSGNRMTGESASPPISIDKTRMIEKTPLIQKQLNIDRCQKPITTSPQMEKQREEMDIWHDVCDLRLTFGLHPPRLGSRFSSESYLGRGRLYELIQMAKGSTRQYDEWSIHVFGCDVSLSSTTSQLQESLHAAEEQMRSVLQRDVGDAQDSAMPFVDSLSDLLRLLVIKSSLISEDDGNMPQVTYNSLEHLITTVKTWKGSANASYDEVLLLLRWYKVEMGWRQSFPATPYSKSEDGLDWQTIFLEACQDLILHLLIYGLNRTMREIRRDDLLEDEETTVDEITSFSAQYWIGIMHLLGQEECQATFGDYCSFWPLLEASLRKYHAVLDSKMNSLIIAENGWYCLLSICALSYFAASSGNAVSRSCLPTGHWSLVTLMISKIRLRADEEVESNMSRSSIEIRDGYIRMLLCRVYHLHSHWGWSFESSESTLTRLYTIFDGHKLKDLPTENHHDFAPFLRHYDESLLLQPLQADDKCFEIFIKILARAASDAKSRSGDDAVQSDRSISRLFSRFSPMRSMNFTKESPPTSLERSGLYNHYSIALMYLYHVPTSRQQRLLQIQGYLSFTKADDKSRLACIRAMMYAMTVLQHHQLDIKECISWFKGAFKLLVAKLEELCRIGAVMGQQLKWQREVKMHKDLLLVAMRSIQYIIKTPSLSRGEVRIDFPNLALLDSAWTSSLMQSQLVLEDTELATEVCETIKTFIDRRCIAMMESNTKRVAAVKSSSATINNEDSQDSCADLFDDADFDDALLLDALESAERPADGKMAKERELRNLDRDFAQHLHLSISPALFCLLSNLFHPERQGKFSLSRVNISGGSRLSDGVLRMLPTLVQSHDKTNLAELLIDVWSTCAWIIVEDNSIRQWSHYFNYGPEDPKRLQGDIEKKDVTLRFLGNISTKYLEANRGSSFTSSDLYGAHITDFWSTFLASLVAPRLTSQHVLCNKLRQLESKRDDLNGGFFKDADWQGKAAWNLEDFECHRVRLLATILRNFGAALDERDNKMAKALPFASLVALLVSVRTYISSVPISERNNYLNLCRQVLLLFHEELSETLNRGISFELKKTTAAIASYDQQSHNVP